MKAFLDRHGVLLKDFGSYAKGLSDKQPSSREPKDRDWTSCLNKISSEGASMPNGSRG